MKTGNVVFAIFLWLCIPVVGLLSGFAGGMSRGSGDAQMCCFTSSAILFIVGLVVLFMGMDKPTPITNSDLSERICPSCWRRIYRRSSCLHWLQHIPLRWSPS